jgi:hypothetical protein
MSHSSGSGLRLFVEVSLPKVLAMLGASDCASCQSNLTGPFKMKINRSLILLTLCCLLSNRAFAEEPYPWELMKDQQFSKAYHAILGGKAGEKWLSTLSGPSTPATKSSILGVEYLVLQSCKPHDCGEHNILIIYSPASHAVYAKLVEEGKATILGKPSAEISSALNRLYEEQFGPQE